jgi:CRISPR/Cas system-associated endonuclease Cas1
MADLRSRHLQSLSACLKRARNDWRDLLLDLKRRGLDAPPRLVNTVYVTTEGASLRKDGENFVAEVDAVERARVPFHMMSSVVVFGAIFVSPPLMQPLAFLGITIVLLDRAGRFQAKTSFAAVRQHNGSWLTASLQLRICCQKQSRNA